MSPLDKLATQRPVPMPVKPCLADAMDMRTDEMALHAVETRPCVVRGAMEILANIQKVAADTMAFAAACDGQLAPVTRQVCGSLLIELVREFCPESFKPRSK